MPLAVLPTRTLGSLGLTKVNRHSVVDPYRDEDASEGNLIRDAIEELFSRIGLMAGAAVESFQWWISKITGPHGIVIKEPGVGLALHPMWDPSVAALPAINAAVGGGLTFTMDAANIAMLPGDQFDRTHLPRWYFEANLSADPGGPGSIVGFVDVAAMTEGFFVRLAAGGNVLGVTMTGGVETTTVCGAWVVGVTSEVEAYIEATHLWVSVDGAAAVDCGAVVATPVSFWAMSGAAGAVGSVMTIRGLRLVADWS